MKKIFLILPVILLFILAACDKKSDNAGPDNSGKEFKFVSLVADDTTMTVNDIMKISANATGEGLTYNWSASYGTFIGSGATVQWTVCHQDRFRVTCEVKDAYNHSESKDIYINVRP